MFWKKKQAEVLKPKVEKLPGPQNLPMPVGRDIVVQLHKDSNWTWSLKAVVRKNPTGRKMFDVRVFSERTAAEKKVKVRDYTSLDEHPELILFEGWFDEASSEAHIVERKTT